ncbi:hypothetical protein BGW41_007668 [Actinomortierella wolfii]|nr:hypothetical protein BGW41_007668 [Actinomortierella wolfii]
MYCRFVLGKPLGTGSFGSVHEARWGNQLCAAKTFFGSQSDFHQQSIQKEIGVLQTLRHRHIIQFYRAHEENGNIYLLMELAEKGSLARAIIKNEISDWQTKERLAQEIAQGLAFIHQEGVLHRDLKSANVLLTKHMEAKLADFGLAKVRSLTNMASGTNASTGVVMGTTRWIAPELLWASKPVYSAKSDVYALGVVMWEMAANCTRPFESLDDVLAAMAIRNGNRETLPEDTPTVYREWVERCWHQDPTQRPEASEVILMQDGSTNIDDANDGEGTTSYLDIASSQSHMAVSQGHRRQDSNGDELVDQAPLGAVDDLGGRLASVDDNDVDLNASDGVKWIFKAAIQGDSNAQFYLGVRYEDGQGVTQSHVEAVKWYTKSALQGNASGQHNLANMYLEGRGVEKNPAEALKWFQMAADQGLASAQCNLGMLYLGGRGIDKNKAEAVRWLTKSANQGYVVAQCNLGLTFHVGDVVEENKAMAVEWYTKAAEQGHAIAQYLLGVCYVDGLGVEQNYAEAVKWLTKAADQGEARAQQTLGFLYQHGHGVRQSNAEAIRWFTKAAVQGNAKAQLSLGLLM